MLQPSQYRWLLFFALLLLGGFGALQWRLYQVQVVRHEELAAKARNSLAYARRLEPQRGEILDRHGRLLAGNQPAKSVYVNPALLGDQRNEMALVLALWAETNAASFRSRLEPRLVGLNGRGQPVYDTHVLLERHVSWEDWGRLRRMLSDHAFGFDPSRLKSAQRTRLHQLQTRAVFAEDDPLRCYPHGRLAGHAIGFATAGRDAGGWAGREGIELRLDHLLRGVPGWRQGERDVRGTEVAVRRQHWLPPRHGLNVVLTIDLALQRIVETELASGLQKYQAASACAVMVRPADGAILAMASLPCLDPGNPGVATDREWRNRAITDVYEPGSTFKIVTYAAALNERFIHLQSVVDCEDGRWEFGGHTLRDLSVFATATVEEAIAHSLSIAAAKIGMLLGPERLHSYMVAFGFGQRTGVWLLGERAGTVHPLGEWSALSITRVPIGYEVTVTPLQMAMAMSVLANGGRRMRPRLVERLTDSEGRTVWWVPPIEEQMVVRPETAREMVAALKRVVSAQGTGRLASVEDFVVAGKTGTARHGGPNGYRPGKYYASFCGFMPADAPEFCLLIVLEDPTPVYFGGRTAAPIFRTIARRAAAYLQLPSAASAVSPMVVQASRTDRSAPPLD